MGFAAETGLEAKKLAVGSEVLVEPVDVVVVFVVETAVVGLVVEATVVVGSSAMAIGRKFMAPARRTKMPS